MIIKMVPTFHNADTAKQSKHLWNFILYLMSGTYIQKSGFEYSFVAHEVAFRSGKNVESTDLELWNILAEDPIVHTNHMSATFFPSSSITSYLDARLSSSYLVE